MLKFSTAVIWRLGTRSTLRKYSSTGAAVFKTDKIDTKGLTSNGTKTMTDDDKENSGKSYSFMCILLHFCIECMFYYYWYIAVLSVV